MEIRDYCRDMEMELRVWKSKLYTKLFIIYRKFDQANNADKEKLNEHINGLQILMSELEERVENLRTLCPTEWKPDKDQIKVKIEKLEKRYNETAGVMVDYDSGS